MRTVWLNRLPQRDLRMFPQAALLQKPHSAAWLRDRKSTRLNSSHLVISYAVFCLKKKKNYSRLRAHNCGIVTDSSSNQNMLRRDESDVTLTCVLIIYCFLVETRLLALCSGSRIDS